LGPEGPEPAINHLWGLVTRDVVTIEVSAPGQRTRRVTPIALGAGELRRTFVVPFVPALRTRGSQQSDILQRTFELDDGPVIIRALDADGQQIAAYAFGKAGCPVPPGCPI